MTTKTTVARLAVAGILAVTATAACNRGSGDAARTEATDDEGTSSSTASVAPSTTAADPTSDDPTDTTSESATTSDPGAATTSAPPDAGTCSGFEAFGPFGRMLAVEEDSAPSDSACADEVASARAALDVYRTTQRTFPEGYRDRLAGTTFAQACDSGGGQISIKTPYDEPVIWWGAGYVTNAEEQITAFFPFISQVAQPGDDTDIPPPSDFPGPPEGGICAWDFDAVLAPTGDLAADAGLVPAPADDPQASDDPKVWFPALTAYEDQDAATLVNLVEDIHSPDVFPTDPDGNSTDTTAPETTPGSGEEVKPVLTFCRELPLTQPEGTEGQLTMVLYSWARAGTDPSQNVQLGLFRRGSDNRWRFAGRTRTVYEFPGSEPQALCDFPSYPLQDLNASSE